MFRNGQDSPQSMVKKVKMDGYDGTIKALFWLTLLTFLTMPLVMQVLKTLMLRKPGGKKRRGWQKLR